MASKDSSSSRGKDSNPDPITGAPGSHPVGTGIGAAAGGAATGAAVGTFAGPVGTAIGAVAGAVVGGLAGKGVAEKIDPTTEDAYWRENYKSRPYAKEGADYSQYAPAYQYGWESRQKYEGKEFDEVEPQLRQDWTSTRGQSGLDWDNAKLAARDAWHRIGSGSGETRQLNEGQASIPVMEEQVEVGKRQVERGGVRVTSHVEEKPVEAQVNLREEHVKVDRRPVDRPASDADFNRAAHAGTIEVTEKREVPVVAKEARVVEEVVVGKEATERTETVRDTVRRTDVEVEQVNKSSPDATSEATRRQQQRTDR